MLVAAVVLELLELELELLEQPVSASAPAAARAIAAATVRDIGCMKVPLR
jgi:hypothetical protein